MTKMVKGKFLVEWQKSDNDTSKTGCRFLE